MPVEFKQGLDTYTNPALGYQVLTSQAHLKCGICCGNRCRHCSFKYINVPSSDIRSNYTFAMSTKDLR